MEINKKKQGKKNRQAGARFELKVRKDLESKDWIVSKWMNNVEFSHLCELPTRLVPAKHKFRGLGIPMAIGTGFPDFIAFRNFGLVIGVEVKSKGYLTKEEKLKCKWLLDNNIFSKILVASKGLKRGEIKYSEFKNG